MKHELTTLCKDSNGNTIEFERWRDCVNPHTAIRNMKKLLSNELYRKCTDGVENMVRIEVYRDSDRVNMLASEPYTQEA